MNNSIFDGAIFEDAETVAAYPTTLDDIVGLENLKFAVLLFKKMQDDPSGASKFGIKQPVKGLIFEGEPGCGKTLFGKLLAKILNSAFLYLSSAELQSAIPGLAKGKVKKVFKHARKNAPCVIFFDEADAVAQDRESGNNAAGGVVQQLLTELDGQESNEGLVVIMATNLLHKLDSALKRSGRFDRVMTFSKPNVTQRTDAFQKALNDVNKSPNLDLKVIGEITDGINYADVKAIIAIAAGKAFHRNDCVTNKDLIEAVQILKVGESSNANTIDAKSANYIRNHVSGHVLAYIYKPGLFVFAQTKTGHKIDCIPTHQNRKVLDIDDIIIQLLSIYVAKETNFSKTGASTTLYTEGDTKVATKLLNKALAMLNVTSVDEDKFILIEQAMHTQLTKFAKAILKNYKETYENIKQKLATSACITREELKLIIKQTVSITPKELFLEFKKMIEALLRSAQAGYVYLNTEEDDKNATEQIIDN